MWWGHTPRLGALGGEQPLVDVGYAIRGTMAQRRGDSFPRLFPMTPGPPVRLAQPEDAEHIAAMSRDLIERGLPWNWRSSRVLNAIRNPETNVAVVSVDGALVAFGIMEYAETHAYLALLAVRPSRQRRGIGSSLLSWLEVSARVAGAQRIRLETRRDNAPARTFYNELGYHEVAIRQGRYSDGIDGIVLEKWLRAGLDS